MAHVRMSQKMACQHLGINGSHLHVWLKHDKLGFRVQTQSRSGHKTTLHQVAGKVIKVVTKKLHQSARKLPGRSTKARYPPLKPISVVTFKRS